MPALLVALGAFVLLVASSEEPYHIDELRQTRHYASTIERVVEESRGQEQPPLDPILNAIVQRLVGVGDVRQRLLSVGFAVMSLASMWALTNRIAMTSIGSATTVGVMALTPSLIVVSAYARPYALPLFLMLACLLLGDLWLQGRKWWILIPLAVLAVLLPWSRTVEPVIFLVAVLVVTIYIGLRKKEFRGASLSIAAVSLFGLISSVFALQFVAAEIKDRTSTFDRLPERLVRLVEDILPVIGSALPYWPGILLALAIALTWPPIRRRLFGIWWWWVLVAVAIGFAIAFAFVAPLSQPFYQRYAFTWVPPSAVLLGVVATATTDAPKHIARSTAIILSTALLFFCGYLSWMELTSTTNADWKRTSTLLNEDLPADVEVLYDPVRQFGSYRTPYAGFPRYTGSRERVPLSLDVVRNPELIDGGSDTAVLLLTGVRYEVPGWTAVTVDRFFTLYLPTVPMPGRAGAAMASAEFAEAVGLENGAALRLVSAAIWLDLGESSEAQNVLLPLLLDQQLVDRAIEAFGDTAVGEMLVARP